MNWRLALKLAVLATTLLTANAGATPPTNLVWSPNGDWISYVVETPIKGAPPRTSWLFDPRDDSGARLATWNQGKSKLWATKIATRESVLLDESNGPMTAPGWSPDGRGMAFGRVVRVDEGRGRYEVVCIEGTGRRVLLSQPYDEWGMSTDRFFRSAAAWSPDGRYLAVPQVRPGGIAILRADSGRLVKSLEHALFPAWTLDGTRLVYVSTGEQDQLECLDIHSGTVRRLAEIGSTDGPPMIEREGLSALLLSRVAPPVASGSHEERVDIVRIRLDDGSKVKVADVLPGPRGDRPMMISTTSMTADRGSDNFLTVVNIEGQPTQIGWFRPRDRQIYKRFPVLDQSLTAADLCLSPSGDYLALRVGEAGARGLPTLCELDSMQIIPLSPDDAAREAWVSRLVATTAGLLREIQPRQVDGALDPIGRPVLLPFPGEVDTNSEILLRIRRLARIGRPLSGDSPASSSIVEWGETRLLFDYLRDDFFAALDDLDAIVDRVPSPDRRRRLLAVRAQIYAGLGDYDRARGTLSYLDSIEGSRLIRVFESTSQGPRFTEARPDDFGWPTYALVRVDQLEAREDAEDEMERTATDHHNPDAPVPGLGLDLEAPAVPPAPERAIPQ